MISLGVGGRGRIARLPRAEALMGVCAMSLVACAHGPAPATHHAISDAHGSNAEQLPGVRLQRLGDAWRRGRLSDSDRPLFASLLVRRARQRLSAGDSFAYSDLELAAKMGHSIDQRMLVEAYFVAARRAATSVDAAETAHGRLLVGRIERMTPRDARLAAFDLADTNRSRLAIAARWFSEASVYGARNVLSRYVDLGGAEPQLLDSYVRGHMGDAEWRPSLAIVDALLAAGHDACVIAKTPDDLGCRQALPAIADDPERSAQLWKHADDRFWVVATPERMSVWVAISLHAWLRDSGQSWLGALAARIHAAGLTSDVAKVAPFARATLLRLAGHNAEARRALDDVLGRLSELTPGQRDTVLAEAVMQQRVASTIERIAASGATTDSVRRLRWRAQLSNAVPTHRRDHFGARFGAILVRLFGSQQTETLARIRQRWGALSVRDGPTLPLGVPGRPEYPVDVRAALVRIADLHLRGRADVDREAQTFAASQPWLGATGPWLGRLFADLGDTARARHWWQRVAETNPRHERFHLDLAMAHAAAGEPDKVESAMVIAMANTASAADHAVTAATRLHAMGYYLRALRYADLAIKRSLSRRPYAALAQAIASALAVGRRTTATELIRYWIAITPQPYRATARIRLAKRWGVVIGGLGGPPTRVAQVPDLAYSRALVDTFVRRPTKATVTAIMRDTMVRSPMDVDVRARVLQHMPATSSAFVDALVELVAIAQAGPAARRSRALRAVASGLSRLGHHTEAGLARREARALWTASSLLPQQ